MRKYSHMNTAALLDGVFDVYKKSFIPQVAFAAIVGVISFVVILIAGVVVTFIAAFTVLMPMGLGYDVEFSPAMYLTLLASVGAVVLPLVLLWQSFVSSGHILLAKQAFYGERVRITVSSLPGVVARVASAIFAQVVLSLPFVAVVGGVAYFVLTPAMVDNIFAEAWMGGGDVVAGFFLVFTVGISLGFVVYSNIFSLAVAAAVLEGQVFFGAVWRSWQLVKVDFWKILGLRLLWVVMIMAITYSAQGFVLLFQQLLNFVLQSVTVSTAFFDAVAGLQGFVAVLIMFIVSPLDGIMPAMIYFNQRIKTEGLDIEIELEKLQDV